VVAAEVDGALHLTPRRWWADPARQNELSISGALVLRFPSAVVRTEPGLVTDQLRRALWC
jgi:very-short-patch-repair endonuclease